MNLNLADDIIKRTSKQIKFEPQQYVWCFPASISPNIKASVIYNYSKQTGFAFVPVNDNTIRRNRNVLPLLREHYGEDWEFWIKIN